MKKVLILITFNFLLLPSLLWAQQPQAFGIKNPLEVNDLWDVVLSLVKIVRTIAIPFIVLAIMWAGFLFVTAQGKQDKLTNAKKVLLYTIVAALIILSAQGLAEVLRNTFLN